MNRISVDVKVGRIVREFIVSSTGTDVLDPDKHSVVWCLTKQHLVTAPKHYNKIPDRSEYISILLRNRKSCDTYSVPADRVLQVNTLFRTYLSEKGHNVIKLHFEKQLKSVFRNYMTGCINNNPDIKIITAIENFCTEHKLTMDNISVEMLKKDWYRYRLNKTAKNFCPLIL